MAGGYRQPLTAPMTYVTALGNGGLAGFFCGHYRSPAPPPARKTGGQRSGMGKQSGPQRVKTAGPNGRGHSCIPLAIALQMLWSMCSVRWVRHGPVALNLKAEHAFRRIFIQQSYSQSVYSGPILGESNRQNQRLC